MKEKEELNQLRKEKLERFEHDISVLKKCINACATAIDVNQKSMGNITKRIEKLENKAVDQAIERMFG